MIKTELDRALGIAMINEAFVYFEHHGELEVLCNLAAGILACKKIVVDVDSQLSDPISVDRIY